MFLTPFGAFRPYCFSLRSSHWQSSSVTSPGLDVPNQIIEGIRLSSPHIKHVNVTERGYSVLRVAEDRTTCEYWAVSTILERGGSEQLSATFDVAAGANRITQQGVFPVDEVTGLLGV